MHEIDIWRAAKLLIDQHGEDAPIDAAMRADQMLDNGDLAGCAAWMAIRRAVNILLLQGKPTGERIH